MPRYETKRDRQVSEHAVASLVIRYQSDYPGLHWRMTAVGHRIDARIWRYGHLWAVVETKARWEDAKKTRLRSISDYPDWFVGDVKSRALGDEATSPEVHQIFAFLFAEGVGFVDVREIEHLPLQIHQRVLGNRGDPPEWGRFVPTEMLIRIPA